MSDSRSRGRHADIEDCKAALTRSSRCTWLDCNEFTASRRDRQYGPAPLCVAHFYEVWQLARDLADRRQNRKPELDIIEKGMVLKTIEVPVSKVGWIYYLRIGESIKIGYAGDLHNRMKAYPPTTEFLFGHPGTKTTEKVTHSLLTLYRNARREWYTDCPEVRDYVDQMIARYSPGDHHKPGSFFRSEGITTPDQPMRMRRRSGPIGRRVA